MQGSAEREDEVRIVLLGKTGVGKSATGNTILGRVTFIAEESFESVTRESRRESSEVNGRRVTVIDTPGLFDTELSNEEIRREITHCISMILPGPHVFLLLIPLGRFTKEEQQSVRILQEMFGDKSVMFTMVLFTRGDFLKNKTIEQCLGKPGSAIRKLTEACGNRVHVFNNNETGDRTQVQELLEKIDNMLRENGGSFYSCKMFRKMERERQERQMKILMDRDREREEEMKRLEEEKERMKKKIEEEQKIQEEERKRREEELKREIREEEKHQREIREEMRRERETFRQEIEEMRREKEKIMTEKDDLKTEYETEIDRLMNRMKNERENQETERTRREEEINQREDENKRIMTEKEKKEGEIQDQMRREQERLRHEIEEIKKEKEKIISEKNKRKTEYETEIEKLRNMIKNSFRNPLEISAYRRLESEYSKWSWSLRRAMMETQSKLHNRIENETIYEVKETDLQRELKTTSDEVTKSMSEFFEKDRDKHILIQWKASFEIKIKEFQDNIVRETKRKLTEILQQRDLKKKIDDQRKHHENTLYEKSKKLALKPENKTKDEETLRKMFDLFWEDSVKKIISDTPLIRDIDIMRDVRKILSDSYESVPVDHSGKSRDIFTVPSFSVYVRVKKPSGFLAQILYAQKLSQEKVWGFFLSEEEEAQIRSFVTDVSLQTDKMIQSFNISKMGYTISCIQQLTGYIKAILTEHEGGRVEYVFKNEFFVDLVLSICQRAERTITDQHRLFREANDPVTYVERKRDEYYTVFQKYCHGAASAAVFGEIICQKLKEPIEQSVYRKTSIDLSDEMRSNCESLNGNRSNLEKHILKTLAEEEDFGKYMDYIKNPRDLFKSFIRYEVSRYITDQFSVSVLPKMEDNIKLMRQTILRAACESTEHVQVSRGDAGLWLKSFSQKLSEELIFSEKDLSGVKHEDFDDFKLLEDVIKKELTAVMTEIRRRFSRETFPSKLGHKFRPEELLIDHFCQCCWVQCPFCKAICTNTIENHPGDHSVPCHRVTGINGFSYRRTSNLCTCICTSAVASDLWFSPSESDETVPWREYRSAGGEYENWSITPELSELPYWKWFVCRFQEDLEKHYSKTFSGRGTIPDEWRYYTKQVAIKSLDEYK